MQSSVQVALSTHSLKGPAYLQLPLLRTAISEPLHTPLLDNQRPWQALIAVLTANMQLSNFGSVHDCKAERAPVLDATHMQEQL